MEIGLEEVLKDLLEERVAVFTSKGIEEKRVLHSVKVISMGAEAVIARAVFLDTDVVVKWRFPKPYMPEELDKMFRKVRTTIEAKALLKSLTLGVNVPTPMYVDPEEGLLIMSYIDGDVLRDIVGKMDRDSLCSICSTVGEYVAKLHENSIVHGDVTTSNIIVERGSGEVFMIDFGLANFVKRVEDQAIDVHIFFRSIESTHHEVENPAKKCFIEGYRRVRGDAYTDKVMSAVSYIRKMGRYVAERRLRGVWTST